MAYFVTALHIEANEALTAHDFGVLAAATAFGKTVVRREFTTH